MAFTVSQYEILTRRIERDEEVRDGDHLQVVHCVVAVGHVLEVRPGVHQELDGGEMGGGAAGAVYHRDGGESQLLEQYLLVFSSTHHSPPLFYKSLTEK